MEGSELLVFHNEGLPAALVDWLVDWVQSASVTSMQGSWHLVDLLRNHWDLLTIDQRIAASDALESAFPRFVDWMSCFTITELLGESGLGDRALQILLRLSIVPAEIPRSLVCHGLEHLAEWPDSQIATTARNRLEEMRGDACSVVRDAAEESLGKLQRRA